MGRDFTAVGCEVPVKAKAHMADIQHIAYKLAVAVGAQLGDKTGPGGGQFHAILVVQHIAVVAGLPMLALFAEKGPEPGDIRHARQ